MNWRFLLKKPWRIPEVIIGRLPGFEFLRGCSDYQNKVGFWHWFGQRVLNYGGNGSVYWPVSPYSQVFDCENISIGVDVCPGLMKGCYIQGRGGITIGDFTQIGPNVGIISANHEVHDLRNHVEKSVRIGAYCWIGMNSVILPGVELGDFTVVGAGSIVTASFVDGYQVIAGNPAKLLRRIDPNDCVRHNVAKRFIGFYHEENYCKLLRKSIS